MQELVAKREELWELLETETRVCRQSGIALAENEKEYRMALRIEILNERNLGTPVTIIGDICRGDKRIAELKRLRDASEAVYKASQEAINVYKLRIRTINEEIDRIWNSGRSQ